MDPLFWVSLGIVCTALGRAIDTLWDASRDTGPGHPSSTIKNWEA